jgi:membrane protein
MPPVPSRFRARPRAFAAVLVAVARRFYDDQCLVRASALAYTSLLSIVPLLAVMFAVLKGLGVQNRLESILLSRLSLDPETTDMIIGYIDNTNFSTLGALGAATLVVTVISVLGTIESSFNLIWRVERPRSLWRQVTDYLSVVMLTPFLLLAGVAITSAAQVQAVMQWVVSSGTIGGAAVQALQLTPVAMNAVGIGVLYAVMPNRRPAVLPVVIGAVFAGIAWHLVQIAYLALQVGVARNNAIYGALAQLPVTLVWLYVSWVIVLAGAELAAVLEFGAERAADPRRPRHDALALHLLVRAADAFASGRGEVEPLAVARELRVDPQDVTTAVGHLRELRWVDFIDAHPHRLVLTADPQHIALSKLTGLGAPPPIPSHSDPRVASWLAAAEGMSRDVWAAWTLADLLASATPGQDRAAGQEQTSGARSATR